MDTVGSVGSDYRLTLSPVLAHGQTVVRPYLGSRSDGSQTDTIVYKTTHEYL